MTETPFAVTIGMKFGEHAVHCETEANVGFGSTEDASPIGKAE